MMTSYTVVMERLGQFADRFFNGYDPHGHFKEHIARNAISKGLMGLVAISVWFSTTAFRIGSEASPAALKQFLLSDAFYVQYLAFSTISLYQLPIQLFAACSLFSIWATYNNYILIIHHDAINWSVRIVASFAVAIMGAVFLLGFLFPYSKFTVLLIALGYGAALEVAYSLRNSLKHRIRLHNHNHPPELAMRITTQWLFVNGIIAVALLICFGLPSTKDLIEQSFYAELPRAFFQSMIIWQWLVYPLAYLLVLVSAIRSGVYLDYEKYAQEIQQFNARISSSSSPGPSTTLSPGPSPTTSGPTGVPGASGFMTLLGVFRTTRLFGATMAALLLGVHTQSFIYGGTCLFFLTFSFVFNDLADFYSGRDFVSHPSRPLPAGTLTPGIAKLVCIGLLSIGFVLSMFSNSVGMFAALYLTSILYSIGLKRFAPIIATPLWCLALTTLVAFPGAFDGLTYALVFLFLYGRELLLDLRDVNADNKFAFWPSLPSLLGKYTHWLVIVILVAIAAIGLLTANPIVWLGSVFIILTYAVLLLSARDNGSMIWWMTGIMRLFMIGILGI